ncbi:hypothetical protein PJG4_173 [Pseudomonas phage JG004]|uniref:Uncharacterized protein n=1 Tax=Pseudomonas phage JG004 TaxID=757342 RepID=F4YDS2_9CAUD|nr:hypothetical protein PJG4_173 [Pseudomonas phage JG004]ADF58294.2 hypothetical protein PJG4_173 [Pseudomonas phage JG004]
MHRASSWRLRIRSAQGWPVNWYPRCSGSSIRRRVAQRSFCRRARVAFMIFPRLGFSEWLATKGCEIGPTMTAPLLA